MECDADAPPGTDQDRRNINAKQLISYKSEAAPQR
jgi:hypothetical protein